MKAYTWLGLIIVAGVHAVASPMPLSAQSKYTERKWTIDEGLPDSQVCGVVQGQDGYLWLATVRHLVRFDGFRFMTVAMPAQSTVGRNEGIFQDSRGGLWVYGFLGAVRYKDGTWWRSEAAGMPRGRVTSVTEGADGTLYLAQERVIYAWKDGVAHPILKTSDFKNETGNIRQLAWNRDGGLWIAMGDGLYCWSPDKAVFPSRMTDIRAEWVLLSAADQPLVAHGSFVCLRRKGGLWERLPELRLVSVRCLLQMPEGELWAGHDNGLDIFSENTWHNQSYGYSCVLGMVKDRENNVWLATTEGLVRMRPRTMQAVPIQGRPAEASVSALWVASDGNIWAGLRSGGLAAGDVRGLEALPVPQNFSDIVISALYREADGTLWCGGSGGKLWTLRKDELQQIEGAYADDVRCILGGGGAPSWIATRHGVFAFNGKLNILEDVAWPAEPVLALWQDSNGFLWVGHESLGLAVLRSGGRDESLPETELPGKTIRALYRDSEGILWIGGLAGLARWDDNRRFVFRRAHGLWNESIRQISEDASGCLWIGTAGGIMRIAKRELADVAAGRKELLGVRTFGVEAGMESGECTGGVFFPAGEPPRDRLWFPTRAGLVTVETRNMPQPRPAPEVRLLSVEQGSLVTMHAKEPWVSPARFSEEAHPHDVRIEYTALDFSTPERVLFRFELSGPVPQRSGLTEERHVTFSRLQPGDYSFRVTACNGDGIWNPDGVVVKWTVYPFFWETLGFRLGVLAFCVGCVALGVRILERRRARSRLEAAERQESLSLERARIARDLHDEIGAKLTRLSLLGSMAAEDANSTEPLRREIEEMADTARETHRAFDEIVWSVSPRNDTGRSLSHYICKYAEEFFTGTSVRCHVQLPEDISDLPVDPTRRHQFFLAVKEGLHNILKHARATQVDIIVRLPERGFCVELVDNGCGFDLDLAKNRGDGLCNMHDRMKAVDGTLSMKSCVGEGTRLVFEMPLVSGEKG